MNAHTNPTGASIIPTVRYRDVGAAVAWLQDAFGLQQHRLVRNAQGAVLYAELASGTGMVMVAPIQETPFGKLMVQPDQIGGVETQICYLFVEDARAHYARAKAAGAEILLDVEVEANGGRGYSCRDPEGHVWNFGTYDPWDGRPAAAARPSRYRRKLVTACVALGLASAVYMHEALHAAASDLALAIVAKVSAAVEPAQVEQTPNLADNGPADRILDEMREQLSRARLARDAADRQLKDMSEELMRERRARAAAELAASTARESQTASASPASDAVETRNQLAKLRDALDAAAQQVVQISKAKDAAERGAKEAREHFARLDAARKSAEQAAKRVRALALRERSRRIVAERTLRIAKQSPYTPYPLN